MIISNLKTLAKIFYGELFNFKNPIKIRIFRIIARSKLSIYFEKYYLTSRKNHKIKTHKNDYIYINESKSATELKENGITLNLKLKDNLVSYILDFINNKEFQFNRNQKKLIKFSDRNKYNDLYILNYMNPHLDNEVISNILHNEKLIYTIKNYLKVEPILEWSQIYWSLPFKDKKGETLIPPNNEYGYHYDIDGFKFLKVFFYLTDVTSYSGPHVFIEKSGDKTLYKALNRRIDEEEVKKKFGEKKLIITGKKGTGFIEDTSFYHKGTSPNYERGVLSCLYNISKW